MVMHISTHTPNRTEQTHYTLKKKKEALELNVEERKKRGKGCEEWLTGLA